jgi:hypothetical protein
MSVVMAYILSFCIVVLCRVVSCCVDDYILLVSHAIATRMHHDYATRDTVSQQTFR